MEKYGVQDPKALQEAELAEVQGKIAQLRVTHEKTASEQKELEGLTTRESELKEALADH